MKLPFDPLKKVDSVESLNDSDWDATLTATILKSERRAWLVAMGACVMTGAVIAGSLLMPPQVVQEPYVVRVNDTTGVVDVMTSLNGEELISPTDALNKANLAAFVKAYEGYHYYNLQAPYNLVAAMAGESVGTEYAAIYSGEEARDKAWRDSVTVDIDILSVVPSTETGTVRFKKTTRINGRTIESLHVATIAFGYYATDKAPESVRLLNPLGFRVALYRVDEEIGGAS